MKKIIVVGSNGLLGQTLINSINKLDYKIFALARGCNRNQNNSNFTYYDVDITDKKSLLNIIDVIKPDYIINAAAVTNVDYCETHQQECDAVNVEAVDTLIEASKKHNIHLVHISTDFVFDGLKGNYKETDATNPLNYYGLSKLKSEQLFEKTSISYTILRTILVFGYVPELKQQNILLWLLDKMQKKVPLTMVNDQLRTPTYVEDLAKACLSAIKTQAKGIYNISGSDLLDMYQLSNLVAKTFNYDEKSISAIPTSQLNQPAIRPKITGFDISKSKKDLNFSPLSFTDALEEIKSKISQHNVDNFC
ncbi:MAG: SDR family oxidoreductase [Flavobacteriales bacterium]|nr:SDR family oxidoreductase [Flavobacteriales bacterium]